MTLYEQNASCSQKGKKKANCEETDRHGNSFGIMVVYFEEIGISP